MYLLYYFIVSLVLLLLLLLFQYKKGTKSNTWWAIPILCSLGIFLVLMEFTEWPTNANAVGSQLPTPLNTTKKIVKIKQDVLLDAPVIEQLPELPRGCEVTSLAMLLQYAGVHVDKMQLAAGIIKEPSRYQIRNGVIYFGHPNDGFVGNMYTKEEPGLGVYHRPIAALLEQYLPGSVMDLTGQSFHDVKTQLSDGRPVWVITNMTYRPLPDSMFEQWETPSGSVNVTYKEHSVLITGYDAQYVYFNDPLTGEKNKKAPSADFIEAWVQMGSQAVTYMN